MGKYGSIIRNISATGAYLEVASLDGIPKSLPADIKPEIRTRSCEVAWRIFPSREFFDPSFF